MWKQKKNVLEILYVWHPCQARARFKTERIEENGYEQSDSEKEEEEEDDDKEEEE